MKYSELSKKASIALINAYDEITNRMVEKDPDTECVKDDIKKNFLSLMLPNFALTFAMTVVFEKMDISDEEIEEKLVAFTNEYKKSFEKELISEGIQL